MEPRIQECTELTWEVQLPFGAGWWVVDSVHSTKENAEVRFQEVMRQWRENESDIVRQYPDID